MNRVLSKIMLGAMLAFGSTLAAACGSAGEQTVDTAAVSAPTEKEQGVQPLACTCDCAPAWGLPPGGYPGCPVACYIGSACNHYCGALCNPP